MKQQLIEFDLAGHEYIELKNLLKICNLCESGGEAKFVIDNGQVKVSGKTETRKSLKLISGQSVEFKNIVIKII